MYTLFCIAILRTAGVAKTFLFAFSSTTARAGSLTFAESDLGTSSTLAELSSIIQNHFSIINMNSIFKKNYYLLLLLLLQYQNLIKVFLQMPQNLHRDVFLQ